MSTVATNALYVSLLRGINVGGHNKVRMKELEQAYTDMGFTSVRYYIQSGNLVFAAPQGRDTAGLEKRIEMVLVDRFGVEADVMVLTEDEFRQAVDASPFSGDEAEKTLLMFISGEGCGEWAEKARPQLTGGERLEVRGGVAYMFCPNGQGRSKAAGMLSARPGQGIKATGRNWRTVNKLLEMLTEARKETR